MRIIPDDAKSLMVMNGRDGDTDYIEVDESDTIELTDAEWDDISKAYIEEFCHIESSGCDEDYLDWIEREKPFPQYLRELIGLKRSK